MRQIIVTRPAAQATGWVHALQALGQPAQALPLIVIAPVADRAPLLAASQHLSAYSLVLFVSANAVSHFFAAAPPPRWPEGVSAGATGPGTSAALRAAGVPAAALAEPAPDAERFDSEALWERIAGRAWGGRRVLVVRGEEGRDWLAETLRSRGATVEFVAAYKREVPAPSAAESALLAAALATPAAYLWHFSSSEAIANLRLLAPNADWSRGAAIVSHPRIGEAARAAGFGQIALARPAAAAVVELAARWPPIQSQAL